MMSGRMTMDELFDGWERAWSGRDTAAFESLCDDDVHYEDPLTPEPLEGWRAIGKHAERLWSAFPDARMQRTGERLHNGPYAVAPVKVLATHRREVAGLAATNRFVIVHCVLYCELREERLLRIRAFFDLYGAAVQLGVLPRPGTMGEKALLMLRGFGLRT
jgi:ketosteroid isomerase-like protein